MRTRGAALAEVLEGLVAGQIGEARSFAPFGVEWTTLKSTSIVQMATIGGVGFHPKGHPVVDEDAAPFRFVGIARILLARDGEPIQPSASDVLSAVAVSRLRTVVALVYREVPALGSFDFDRKKNAAVLALEHAHLDEVGYRQTKRRFGRRAREEVSLNWIAPGEAYALIQFEIQAEFTPDFSPRPIAAPAVADAVASLAGARPVGAVSPADGWTERVDHDGWRLISRVDD
jgi:hypothetical protein